MSSPSIPEPDVKLPPTTEWGLDPLYSVSERERSNSTQLLVNLNFLNLPNEKLNFQCI